MPFNLIDVLLVLLLALSVWGGVRRGFIMGLLDLLRWVVSFAVALCFYQTVSCWLSLVTDWTEVWNQPVAFILIVIVVSLIINLLANQILKRLSKDVHTHRFNHALGALPGLLNGLIMAAIVSSLLFSMPFSDA